MWLSHLPTALENLMNLDAQDIKTIFFTCSNPSFVATNLLICKIPSEVGGLNKTIYFRWGEKMLSDPISKFSIDRQYVRIRRVATPHQADQLTPLETLYIQLIHSSSMWMKDANGLFGIFCVGP